MSDDINVAKVDSLILRLCKEHPRFGEIIEFGLANGLNISNPVEFSKTPKGCKLLFALNYVPTRHDNQHPSIATIIRIVCIILKGSLGYTKEAAEQFLESEVAMPIEVRSNLSMHSSMPTRPIKIDTKEYKP